MRRVRTKRMSSVASVTSKKLPNVYKSCPKMISLEKLKILTPLWKSDFLFQRCVVTLCYTLLMTSSLGPDCKSALIFAQFNYIGWEVERSMRNYYLYAVIFKIRANLGLFLAYFHPYHTPIQYKAYILCLGFEHWSARL